MCFGVQMYNYNLFYKFIINQFRISVQYRSISNQLLITENISSFALQYKFVLFLWVSGFVLPKQHYLESGHCVEWVYLRNKVSSTTIRPLVLVLQKSLLFLQNECDNGIQSMGLVRLKIFRLFTSNQKGIIVLMLIFSVLFKNSNCFLETISSDSFVQSHSWIVFFVSSHPWLRWFLIIICHLSISSTIV